MTTEVLPGEAEVDAYFERRVHDVCNEKSFAKWALLTMSTDRLRIAILSGATSFSCDLASTLHAGLRYGFRALACRPAGPSLPARPHFSNSQGFAFYQLLKDLQDYDQLARMYSMAREGVVSIRREDSRIRFESAEDARPLEVFEIFDNRGPSATSMVYFLSFLSHDPREYVRLDAKTCLESHILRSTSKEGRYRLRFAFDYGILKDLTEHFIPTSGLR